MSSIKGIVPRINTKIARYRLRVGRSRIHRYGVFALEDIPAGKQVIEYTGRRLTAAQSERIAPPKDSYVATLSDRWFLDPKFGGSSAEFINASCEPNLEWRRIRGHLYYFSRRNIRAGEELTGNYRYPTKLQRIPCHCGARGCRGTLRYILGY
jgi:SET domain-containing protein